MLARAQFRMKKSFRFRQLQKAGRRREQKPRFLHPAAKILSVPHTTLEASETGIGGAPVV